jgi:hypothetical protein
VHGLVVIAHYIIATWACIGINMKREYSTKAVVLKTYNVGEADRYCILLTKTNGRLHVRANGARKTGSKLGPYLLGGQCIEVELYTNSSGTIVRGALLLGSLLGSKKSTNLTPVLECCLALLPEDEPAPEVYTVVEEYILNPNAKPVPALLQIVHHLGYIPSVYDPRIIQACTKKEHEVLLKILEHKQLQVSEVSAAFTQRLLVWVTKKIEHETGRPMKSTVVLDS